MLVKHDWNQLFAQRDSYERWLDEHLPLLDAPAILLGDETNTYHFDWDAALKDGSLDGRFKVALVDVDASAYASCSAAVKIFYQELHEYAPDWVVERCFLPTSEANRHLMDEAGIPLMTAEGHMPLSCFNVICCSQQMIGEEVNIAAMLLSLGLGTTWQERGEEDPLIIRGGASSFNPSVIKDVCDLFFMGEGEDVLPPLLSLIDEGRCRGIPKEEILLKATQTWDCLWAPRFYEERFAQDGELLGMFALRDDVPEVIRSYSVPDLDSCFIMTKPIGDFHYPSFISGGIEITRGCDGQCGFCVSGFTYLPFRARSVNVIMDTIKEQLHHTGASNLTLSSFCGSSYPHLNELMRIIFTEVPTNIRMMSQRIDSIHENPELCGLLGRTSSKRIVFGVEGISQRLRQTVSKNYTEEQILDTVRMLCKQGYKTVKFMFIVGLPGEERQDWEELIELSSKLRSIIDEEGREGLGTPKLVYTWTPLIVEPLTPFQWARPMMQTYTSVIPNDIKERLGELDIVVVKDDIEAMRAHNKVTQLLLRGDSRLQPLVIDMARAGIQRHGTYPDRTEAFMDTWMAEHEVPGYDYWFREAPLDTVFPWDFISFGATKEHLQRRYLEACKSEPRDYPRCLTRCQGCGACSAEQRRQMATYRAEKRKDNQLPLSDVLPDGLRGVSTNEQAPQHFAVVDFTNDDRHRVVNCVYWAYELGRSLNYAGIPYDRKSIRVYKPYHERYDWTTGVNTATVALYEKHDDDQLVRAINDNAVNMEALSVRWFDHYPKLTSISYRFPLPDYVDTAQLAESISQVMERTSWPAKVIRHSDGADKTIDADLRVSLFELYLEGRELCMHIEPRLPPYWVYQELLGLSWEEASRYTAVRTSIELA